MSCCSKTNTNVIANISASGSISAKSGCADFVYLDTGPTKTRIPEPQTLGNSSWSSIMALNAGTKPYCCALLNNYFTYQSAGWTPLARLLFSAQNITYLRVQMQLLCGGENGSPLLPCLEDDQFIPELLDFYEKFTEIPTAPMSSALFATPIAAGSNAPSHISTRGCGSLGAGYACSGGNATGGVGGNAIGATGANDKCGQKLTLAMATSTTSECPQFIFLVLQKLNAAFLDRQRQYCVAGACQRHLYERYFLNRSCLCSTKAGKEACVVHSNCNPGAQCARKEECLLAVFPYPSYQTKSSKNTRGFSIEELNMRKNDTPHLFGSILSPNYGLDDPKNRFLNDYRCRILKTVC